MCIFYMMQLFHSSIFMHEVLEQKVLFVRVHSCLIRKIPNLKTTQMFINCEWINKLGSTHTWYMSLSSKYIQTTDTVMLLRWYNSFLVSSTTGRAVLVMESISKLTTKVQISKNFLKDGNFIGGCTHLSKFIKL